MIKKIFFNKKILEYLKKEKLNSDKKLNKIIENIELYYNKESDIINT